VEVSSPGRICLFGEHQDYLGLPVIAMAMNLRLKIHVQKRKDKKIIIDLPDIGESKSYIINDTINKKPKNIFTSGMKICIEEGLTYSRGFEVEIHSKIPIKAGASSSSALMVTWINLLSQMADNPIEWNNEKIAQLSYQSEVTEFNLPGGMMDQYSSAFGNFIYLQSLPKINIQILNPNLGFFVLGDSCEPKDTIAILKRCRDMRLNIIRKLKKRDPNFDLNNQGPVDVTFLSKDEKNIFNATINNRDILSKALPELKKDNPDSYFIGKCLLEHHEILRDVLDVSTVKIDNMLDAALDAGALGGKITGSGGGGCMFAYAPDNPEIVAEAIEKVGGKSFIINSDVGTLIKKT
jgi:galactokinase